MEQISSNKRVAKNAIALTLRMVLVTIVGLYTSRIVLEALGVDDYGIYGVIGGVVGMASFLNAAMAGATSRFITFELGRGNSDKLRKIFSTVLIIHVIIAVIVAILAETVGLWFVNNKMNFPPERMFAVNVLYQFTILSMFVSFTQVPYNATIIAHEKMNIYAYFEIINVVLKLLIVYLLLIVSSDRLIFYAAAMLGVSLISAMIYRFYCIRHFRESIFKFVWDKRIIHEIMTYSGFDLYGNMCAVIKSQGQPIVLNMFLGVVANAASSIASTMSGAISGLTSGIFQAFRPQIIKTYANQEFKNMERLIWRSTDFSIISLSALSIPFFINTKEIILIWLGELPLYSVEVVRLILIAMIFSMLININNTVIQATGDIKRISIFNGSFYLLCPIFSYIVMKFIYIDISVIYIVNILFLTVIYGFGLFFISKQVPNIAMDKYIRHILKCFGTIFITFFCVLMLKFIVQPSNIASMMILHTVLIFIISFIMISILSFVFIFGTDERRLILRKIESLIIRLK